LGSVFVRTMMSLDGFVAGPNDDMSWVFRHAGDMPGAVVDEVIARNGAVLEAAASTRSAGKCSNPTRGLFDGRWRGPHLILTHAPPTDEIDPIFSFLSGDVRDAVAKALTAADGRDVLVLGANVVNQCLRVGLVDEILIHVVRSSWGRCAVVRCLDLRASLTTLDVSASGQVVNLRLRVDKAVA